MTLEPLQFSEIFMHSGQNIMMFNLGSKKIILWMSEFWSSAKFEGSPIRTRVTSKYFPDPCTVDEMSQKSLKQGVVYFSAFHTFLPLCCYPSDFKIVFRIEIRGKTNLKMALKNKWNFEIEFSKVIQKFNSQPISILKTILDWGDKGLSEYCEKYSQIWKSWHTLN